LTCSSAAGNRHTSFPVSPAVSQARASAIISSAWTAESTFSTTGSTCASAPPLKIEPLKSPNPHFQNGNEVFVAVFTLPVVLAHRKSRPRSDASQTEKEQNMTPNLERP